MDKNNVDPQLRKLYPALSDDDLQDLEYRLSRYLEVVLRIYKRLRADPERYEEFRQLLEPEKEETEWKSGRLPF